MNLSDEDCEDAETLGWRKRDEKISIVKARDVANIHALSRGSYELSKTSY